MFSTQPGPETSPETAETTSANAAHASRAIDPAVAVPGVVVAMTLFLLGYVSPTSGALVIPVLLPWGLLAWAFTRRHEDDPADARPVLRLVLLGTAMPATVLALSAYVRAPLHETVAGILLPAVALAAVFAGALLAAAPGLRSSPYVGFAVLASAIYGYGGGVAANIVFDGSEPQVVRAPVIDKWVSNPPSTGRYRRTGEGPSFYVEIDGYGATRVNTEVYSYSKVGQPGCVHVRSGALGMEWFSIERCPPTPRTR